MDELLGENQDNQNRVNFIPCIKWVEKGVMDYKSVKVKLTKKELAEIIKDTKVELRETLGNSNPTNQDDEFDLEHYESEDEEERVMDLGTVADINETAETNDSEPESDDSDREDDFIKPTDNLILVGHVEQDAAMLDVYVYNEEEESLYVHHDILLPSFPLCLEWLNYEPNQPKGSYVAIGSMEPIIDVWDLDLINSMIPSFRLGQKKKRGKEHIGHKDAVLCLAWNKTFDHVIASGSNDKTVLLWDMENQKPRTEIKSFEDRIQALVWHTIEPLNLLAGSNDGSVKLFQCESVDTHLSWKLNSAVETLAWNSFKPYSFLVGTEGGELVCIDCRADILWSIKAHESEITGLAVSDKCPGLLITSASDGVKVWDMNETDKPSLVIDRDFKIGSTHCLQLSPNSPFVFAAGGDLKHNNFVVYDVRNIDTVRQKFESRPLMNLVKTEDHAIDRKSVV